MPGIRQARKYAMWERGELLPSQEPNSMMRCSCGERFDSHDPASNHVHLPHTMRPKRLTGYGAAKVHAPQALLKPILRSYSISQTELMQQVGLSAAFLLREGGVRSGPRCNYASRSSISASCVGASIITS
jgi:hypothetical protein